MSDENKFTIASLMLYLQNRNQTLIEDPNRLELLSIYIYFALEKNRETESVVLEDTFKVFRGRILSVSAHEKNMAYQFQKLSKQYRRGKEKNVPNAVEIDDDLSTLHQDEISYLENTKWDSPVFRYYQVGELLRMDKLLKEYLIENKEGMISDEVLLERILNEFELEERNRLRGIIEQSKKVTWVSNLPLSEGTSKNTRSI